MRSSGTMASAPIYRPGGDPKRTRWTGARSPPSRARGSSAGPARPLPATGRGRGRGRARSATGGFHVPSSASRSGQVPTASPARKPAPSVVASFTGDTSTGFCVASARACTNVGLRDIPPSMRSTSTGRSAVGDRGFDEVGAALRDTFEHRADQLGPAGAAGEAEDGAARAEVPLRRPEPEQRGHEHHTAGVRALLRDLVALVRAGQDAEVVAQPLHVRARREHDRFEPPRVDPAEPPGDDRERAAVAAGLEARTLRAEHHVQHPTGAERDLRRTGPHAGLTEQRRLLITHQCHDRRRARQRGRRSDAPARSPRPSASSIPGCAVTPGAPRTSRSRRRAARR